MARAGYGDLEVGAETSSVQAVHPVGTSAAPGIAFSTDTDVGLYRIDANELGISVGGTGQVAIIDGVLQPITTNDIDLGTASLQFKDAFIDGTLEADAYTVAGTALNEYIADTIGAMVGSNTETNIAVTYQDGDNTLDFVVASDLDTSGNAATATALETARTIGGTSFNGTANIAVGLSATTTALASARTIGGVSFDGTGNIDLPGVNTAGNQATSGLAATATLAATTTALASARTIGGVSFNGTGNIDLPGVNTAGNQATSGLAATATLAALSTEITISANNSTNETVYPTFVDGATGTQGVETDTGLTYNPSTGLLTATSFSGTVTGASAYTRGPAFFMS